MMLFLFLIFFSFTGHSIVLGQEEAQKDKIQLDIGGALRFNYNYSSWKPNQKKRGGDFGFEVFQINVDAIYKRWELHIDQRFYASGFGGAFLKYGWFQYGINDKSHIKLGLIPTQKVGSQAAMTLHYELDYKAWNVKAQWLSYNNQPENPEGESRDVIEMTAYGFPYMTAAKARIYSISIAHTIVLKKGPIESIQLYNDYAYMNKSVDGWEATQMNVLGALISLRLLRIGNIDYGIPFYYNSGPNKGQVRGTITMSFVCSGFKKLVHAMSIGKTGYGIITSKEGTFLMHPINEFIERNNHTYNPTKLTTSL